MTRGPRRPNRRAGFRQFNPRFAGGAGRQITKPRPRGMTARRATVYDHSLPERKIPGSLVSSVPWPNLVLAGFGTSSSLQITLEAQQAAVRLGRVLTLALPGRLGALLQRQGVEVTELRHLLAGRGFAEGYAAVAQAVLARAEHDPPAMFLSQGNPLLQNALNRFLVTEARKRGLTLRVYPGVSPIDVVVSELGIDVGSVGLQSLSARGLVARPAALNPRVPLLLLQLAGLAEGGASAEAYAQLAAVLGRAYPRSQPITLLNMPGDGRVVRATVTLERFCAFIPHIDASSALFIDIARAMPSASTTQTH